MKKYKEKDGVITFSVTSNGLTGEAWITKLEKKGIQVSSWAKELLRSPDFKPTMGITTELAVLKAGLFKNGRTNSIIRAEAVNLNLEVPNTEVACLIREKLSDNDLESMGLWYIVAMHEPIKDSDGYLGLLYAIRDDDGRWLSAYYGDPVQWGDDGAFAFVVSQVSGALPSESLKSFDPLVFEILSVRVNGKTYKLSD